MKTPQPKTYGYSINLDERGYFEADVRDATGKSVWQIDTAGAEELVRDGFVKSVKAVAELEVYLKDIGILNSADTLKSLTQAEVDWDTDDTVEVAIFNFDGFCNTIHSENLSSPADQWFTVDDEVEMPDEFYMDFMITDEMHEKYCGIYVDALKTYLARNKNINLPSLEFASYQGPRNGDYFNGPDVVIASVKLSEFKALLNEFSKPEDLERKRKTVKDLMSSSDGFASYYQEAAAACDESDDVTEWFGSDVEDWDCMEFGTVFLAITGEIDDQSILCEVKGSIEEKASDIVWRGMSEKCRRLANSFNSSQDGPSP